MRHGRGLLDKGELREYSFEELTTREVVVVWKTI
jgi:hypothetical protein